MSGGMKWEKREIPAELVKDIASRFNCDRLTASILIRRGITGAAEIGYFLEDDVRYLHNPYELPAMEDAVDRILAAVEEGEKVLVFGDRDVDGISGTALLTEYLAGLKLDVSWRIPTGDEPYGLSIAVVEEFAASLGTLIITVDCGISNLAEIKRANELGVNVIVTDHHNPQDELPDALAIVNPKLASSTYPFRDLAGCAVAYKLVSALRFALKSELYGQSLCLLNTRPVNDAWVIEIAKLRNLCRIATLTEVVAPDPQSGRSVVGIADTRLPVFLQGQQILVWDAPLQKKTLNSLFGASVEINMLDIAPEIGKEIPSAGGKSLLRILELSRIAKYSDTEAGELDVFVNLFTSFITKKEKLASPEDSADLQLASLGTIADIMPLKDENRVILKQGLKSMRERPRSGLADLLFKLDLGGRKLGTTEISWQVAPAINSAGRMGNPRRAVELFLEKNADALEKITAELVAMNEERKKLGTEIWKEVEPLAGESLAAFSGNIAVASGNIPRGVTGIMANRMMSRFNVPSMAVSMGDEIIIGSLRSVRGYDLRFLLEPCAELFLDWGGHDYAAGFSMEKKNWQEFINRLKIAAVNIELGAIRDEETLVIDAELPLSFMTPDILNTVDLFEPYGEGNEALTFMVCGARVEAVSLMGKTETKHVKLTLDTGKHKWPAVYWQAADKVKREFDLNDRVDLCFRIARNWFKGNETPQLVVLDLKRSKG